MSTSLFTRRLRWTDVARLLDIGYESAALPALVTCPLCQAPALRVYDDQAVRGAWFHCRGCGRGGDGLTFAAAVWGVDAAAAADRFIAEGLYPESVRAAVPGYVSGVAAQRRRMEELWQAASRQLPGWESPGVARLCRQLGVNTGLPAERWRAGPGTLVGAAPAREVERAFGPGDDELARGVRTVNAVFRGRGWRDVLVLPYHSSAGRLSGFGLVGRGGGPLDRAFAAVGSREPAARKDAGLYAAHAAEGNGTVVAVRDDALALRLHCRHFATSGRFLGLVGWRDDGVHATGRGCWQQLNGKRVVHWVGGIDAAVVRQAFFFEADVSTAGPPAAAGQEALLTYCRQADPPDLLKRVVRQARPWRYALSEWLQDAHGRAVEAMASQLAACGIDAHEIARSLPDRDAAERLHALAGGRSRYPGVRSVAFGPWSIEARTDGWYAVANNKSGGRLEVSRVSDFTLRVHQIRVLPDREAYDCEVHYRGRRHVVEIDPRRPLARELVRAGVGIVHIGHRWVGRIFKVATAFDEPVIVREP